MPTMSQRSLAMSLFRDAADEDYAVARWAAINELWNQFSWSAQQAVEKYLKCALLVNDISALPFGHDLKPLFQEVKDFAGGLLPDVLVPPREFPTRAMAGRSHFEIFESFIERVNTNGHANQRYRQYGLTIFRNDVHKLDEAVFLFRRLCNTLNENYLGPFPTNRELLMAYPSHQPGLEISRNWAKDIKSAFEFRNFSFCRDRAIEEGHLFGGTYSLNSQIYLATVRGGNRDDISWLVENVFLSRGDRIELESLL